MFIAFMFASAFVGRSVDVAIFILLLSVGVQPLKCWNCVGHDCATVKGPSSKLIDCPQGSHCQVSTFEMYDYVKNQTRSMIPVRSCSYETGCLQNLDVTDCRRSPAEFAGVGCIQRRCCMDDGCNTSHPLLYSIAGVLWVIVLSL